MIAQYGSVILFVMACLVFGVNIIVEVIKKLFPKVPTTFVATVLSGASVEWLKIADSHDAIMTGVIMLLVPGMAFGTAMRDLFYGDLIAGALKTLQAILSSLMIAFGYMLGMTIFGTIAPSDYLLKDGWLIAKEFITALISALAFAVLFRVNKNHLLWAGLGSIVTYGIYYLVVTFSGNVFLAALISAIFTALYSEVSARLHKAPTLVFLITGVIPTVPGRYLYNTMRYLLEQNWPLAMSAFLDTMKIALGIAAGVVGIAIAWGTISGEIKSRRAKALAKEKT
jgi:uncharacterized membrane protein YjjB (DUF3815 family)